MPALYNEHKEHAGLDSREDLVLDTGRFLRNCLEFFPGPHCELSQSQGIRSNTQLCLGKRTSSPENSRAKRNTLQPCRDLG